MAGVCLIDLNLRFSLREKLTIMFEGVLQNLILENVV